MNEADQLADLLEEAERLRGYWLAELSRANALRHLIARHNAKCSMACNGADFLIRLPGRSDATTAHDNLKPGSTIT